MKFEREEKDNQVECEHCGTICGPGVQYTDSEGVSWCSDCARVNEWITGAQAKADSKIKVTDELHYLRWFRMNTDFGPADEDVKMLMDEQYEQEAGRRVPDGWRREEE